jgi:hypothetical protein
VASPHAGLDNKGWNMTKKTSLKEKIRRGAPTDLVAVWIGAPVDLVREYEQACKALEEAEQHDSPADSLAGPSSLSTEQDRAQVDRLRGELEDYVVEFRLRGLDPKRWERLTSKHPPRQDAEGNLDSRDKQGWNNETFPAALVRATTISPELDEQDWLALLGDDEQPGSLTFGQVDRLAGVAFRLSQTAVDVPFWSAASPTTRS